MVLRILPKDIGSVKRGDKLRKRKEITEKLQYEISQPLRLTPPSLTIPKS